MNKRIDIEKYFRDPAFSDIQTCRDYLLRDIGSSISLLEAIRLGFGKIVYADETALVIYNEGSESYMFKADSAEKFRELIRQYDSMYITVNSYALAAAAEEFGYVMDDNCVQVIYLNEEANDLGSGHDIRVLSYDGYHDLLRETYHGLPEDMTEDHLRAGDIIGLFIDDRIVGYIGAHTEGSIGMLYVIPEYRKHGYAMILENAMIEKKLKEGKIPFAQILESNEASLALQKKLGYESSEEYVLWMHR